MRVGTAHALIFLSQGGLGRISQFFVAREADRVGMPGQEGCEDFVFPYSPRLRIFCGWTRGFDGTPELFPRRPALKNPNGAIRIPPCSLNALQEMMLDEAREGEKATPLRIPNSLPYSAIWIFESRASSCGWASTLAMWLWRTAIFSVTE